MQTLAPFVRRLSAWLLLWLAAVVPVQAQQPAVGEATIYSFQECDSVAEAELRAELNAVAQRALEDDGIAASLADLVEQQWQQQQLDRVIEQEVTRAVAEVREREAYLSRLWSAWSPEKANQLASEITTQAFESVGFQDAIGRLSEAIAAAVAERMEQASIRSVSSALGCLQAFIGQKYSASLLEVFVTQVNAQVGDLDLSGALDQEFSLPGMHSTALAGVGVIIGAQIAKRLARRLSQRITGRIVTRVAGRVAATLVPLVGWIAGAGMIAWDLWEGADGALPQIQEALTSPEVAAEIKQEINAVIAPELARELPKVAREVANSIFTTWADFKRQYAEVLRMADRNPTFKAILADTSTGEIYKLAELVAAGTAALGNEQLDREIDRGRFARLFVLPSGAADILAASGSVDTTLAWGELAGGQLTAAAALELHRLRRPDQLDRATLQALVALNDKTGVKALLALAPDDTRSLLQLPPERLRPLLRRYDADDLRWLAGYARALTDSDQAAVEPLLERLASRPEQLARLKHPRLQNALAAGADVDATLDFLVAKPGLATFLGDASSVAGGSLPLALFWYKYGTPRNIAIVLLVLGLWIGLRMLRSRRDRRPIIVNVSTPPPDERRD